MNQLTLFDTEPATDARPLARASDPATSHAAAREIAGHVGALQEWAARCVRLAPGLTQRELGARFCPEDLRKIGRRLAECARLGMLRRGPARKCTITGRMAETWWPVEKH